MKTIFFLLLFLPFIVKAQSKDTVKVVMLVSDTSTVRDKPIWSITKQNPNIYQDTRPYMAYGYQTSNGELLDAYKRKLGKNIVMWIAYKIK